jgi:hypothetical protein
MSAVLEKSDSGAGMKATEHMRYEQYLDFLRFRQLVDDTTSFESITWGFWVWLKVVEQSEQSEQLLRQAEACTDVRQC